MTFPQIISRCSAFLFWDCCTTGWCSQPCKKNSLPIGILSGLLSVFLSFWGFAIEVKIKMLYRYGKTPQFARADAKTCPNIKKHCVLWTKCTCPWSWLSSCNAQLSYLCVECYNNIVIVIVIVIIIIIIKPLLKIFNECRSLTGVG